MKVAAIILFTCLVADGLQAAIIRSKRDKESTQEYKCKDLTPCGWAVYDRYTRLTDYYMRNECTCPDDKRCIRTEDDISINAYVYRCREVPISSTSK